MVHEAISEGYKGKPRGRPFQKGNKRGKLEDEIQTPSRLKSGDEGGVIAPSLQSSIVEPDNDGIFHQLPKMVIETLNTTIKECMETPQEIKEVVDDKKNLELVDSMEFISGENKLEIRFSRKDNRMYRIQVFLNDNTEIRPVTYSGATTGKAFWNLLKGALKKEEK